MSILLAVKAASVAARRIKDADSAALLQTVIGEAEMIGKNGGNREVTDSEVITLVKKFIKNNEESIEHLARMDNIIAAASHKKLLTENELLTTFLPAQMTEAALAQAINLAIVETGAQTQKDMGKIVKLLKERHDGQYNNGEAATLIKRKLGG